MNVRALKLHVGAVTLAAIFLVAGCKNDELPTNPPSPYLFTQILLSKDTRPVPETSLKVNQQVTLTYKVSYTLTPEEFQNVGNLGVFINVYATTANDSVVNIGTFPDKEFSIKQQADILRDSLSFVVPIRVVGVTLEAFLDNTPFSNPVIVIDRQHWPVE